MDWTQFKKLLGKKITTIYNAKTPNETLELWNGQTVCKYEYKTKVKQILKRANKPIKLVDSHFSRKIVGYEYPPK